MKGVVFTEFLEMVESRFGYETVDAILTMSKLPSGGIYTSIGTYSHHEMVILIENLYKKTNIEISILLEGFGEYLFSSLYKSYHSMFSNLHCAFDMLKSVEHYIHVEVKKLYPDAELPTFQVKQLNDKTLVMDYSSDRSMGDLAVGLIKGCLKQFGESAVISKELLSADGSKVRFTITKP